MFDGILIAAIVNAAVRGVDKFFKSETGIRLSDKLKAKLVARNALDSAQLLAEAPDVFAAAVELS